MRQFLVYIKQTDQYQTMSNKKIAKPSTTPAMTPPIVAPITGEYAMQCSTLLSKVAFYRAGVVLLKQCFFAYISYHLLQLEMKVP